MENIKRKAEGIVCRERRREGCGTVGDIQGHQSRVQNGKEERGNGEIKVTEERGDRIYGKKETGVGEIKEKRNWKREDGERRALRSWS